MLENVKKFGIIIVIAILFGFFSFSIVDLVAEEPEYEDFCKERAQPMRPLKNSEACQAFREPTEAESDDCELRKGNIVYSYDAEGCPTSFECSMCRLAYDEASKQHRLIGFIITSLIGVIAIIVGLYITSKKDVVEWVFSGLLIGGIISIFIGTMMYFQDMGRFVKPFVLLAEIALIIWIAVKTSMRVKGRKK